MRSEQSRTLIWGLIFLCFIFFPGIVSAQENNNAYTLEKSIAEALDNNWLIKAKKEKIDESFYVKKQAKAAFLPKLSTSYGFSRLSEVYKTDPIPLGPGAAIPGQELNSHDNYQWRTTITQPLFTGFALSSSYELTKLGIDLSKIGLELEKLDLILRVKEAYFNILKADRGLDVGEKAVESLESHVKSARSFYKVGMIPVNDLLKAEVELAAAQHNFVKALNATKLARSSFNIVLSRSINDHIEVKDILGFKPEKSDFSILLNRAIKTRPEVGELDINLLQADQKIRLAKSKYYPEVALTYDYIKEGDHMDVAGSRFHDAGKWEVGAGLTWTFWEWGKTDNSVNEARSFKRQLIHIREALVDKIRLEIKRAILDLEEADKNVPTTKKAMEQAEENLRVSQERFKAQVTTSTEVLDAQTLLTQARTNYFTAFYDHYLAAARLQRAIGDY